MIPIHFNNPIYLINCDCSKFSKINTFFKSACIMIFACFCKFAMQKWTKLRLIMRIAGCDWIWDQLSVTVSTCLAGVQVVLDGFVSCNFCIKKLGKMCKKCKKCRFWPAFGVPSNLMLLNKYNIHRRFLCCWMCKL